MKREWREAVAVQAAGSAIGSLVAALIVFLVGTAAGAIDDVPLSAIVGAVAVLVGVVGAIATLSQREPPPPGEVEELLKRLAKRYTEVQEQEKQERS